MNDCTVMAAGGDVADYQFLQQVIKQKQIDEDCRFVLPSPEEGVGGRTTPVPQHCLITSVL